MKSTLRELLDEIVPWHRETNPAYATALGIYRTNVINTLCDGAEILYGKNDFKRPWDFEHFGDTHFVIRLKPQPIKRGVSKQEILDALRDDDYKRMHAELADKIEREGIVE